MWLTIRWLRHEQADLNLQYFQKKDKSGLSSTITSRLAPALKKIFINVPYHILVARLTQSHQSKTSYKFMIWHIDEELFKGLEPVLSTRSM